MTVLCQAVRSEQLNVEHTVGNPMESQNENCDLVVEGGVCLMHERRILLPRATPSGLVGHWTFDDAWPVDSSGNRLHSTTPANAGIGVGHSGSSGSFDRSDVNFEPVVINDSVFLSSADFTLSFWVYIVRPPATPTSTTQSASCVIIRKGDDEAGHHTYPAVFLESVRNHIGVSVGASLEYSNARVSVGRWTHVSLCS